MNQMPTFATMVAAACFLAMPPVSASDKPIKIFVVAGDEPVLEQGPIDGRTDGVFEARSDLYYQNSGTYLEIGAALGKSILELQQG